MADIPVHNPGKNPKHVRGYVIEPGETRILPEHMVPPRLRPGGRKPAPAPEPEPEPDEVLQLLDSSVGDITPELPALSDSDLDRLEQAEQDGKTRKTLMEAFQEERLRRAQQRGEESGDDVPEHIAQILAHDAEAIEPILSEVEDGDLTALYEAESADQAREAVLAAIGAEQERRHGES
ncbi:MAG: hypothetical protein ACLFRB_06840 [Thiohalorhabdus sp.]|uniref:hypothetical protein n=1 Tax=Thiohalorhabdus sp. TaxID=3094134 RepID=UPI0039806438